MYQRFLVPLEGSPLAEAVLPHGQSPAHCTGAEIVLLQVTANPFVEFSFSNPSLAVKAIRELEVEAKNCINEKISELEAAGMRASFLFREGRSRILFWLLLTPWKRTIVKCPHMGAQGYSVGCYAVSQDG